MADIHSSAIVSAKAELGAHVKVGPFAVIEDEVFIGDHTRLAARVVVKAGTRIGCGNELSEGAVLGGQPQHIAAGSSHGAVEIGEGNHIRENVTVHRGLTADNVTRIGNHNMLMVNAHVGHDCSVGNHVIIVNNSLLGGHVEVADGAYLGGAAAVHQFCRVGRLAMVGGQSHITQDVPPFVMVDGKSNLIVGLNLVGLRRGGVSDDQLRQLKAAYRILYRSGMKWSDTLAALEARFTNGMAAEFAPFLAQGRRGFVQERRTPRAATVVFPSQPAPTETTRKAG